MHKASYMERILETTVQLNIRMVEPVGSILMELFINLFALLAEQAIFQRLQAFGQLQVEFLRHATWA